MGVIRKLLFILGILLIVLPFLPWNIIPSGSIIGIDIIDNGMISIAVGVILLIFVLLSWNKERKRRQMLKPFLGPRGLGDAQEMRGMAKALERRRREEIEKLRKHQVMQMRELDKRYVG